MLCLNMDSARLKEMRGWEESATGSLERRPGNSSGGMTLKVMKFYWGSPLVVYTAGQGRKLLACFNKVSFMCKALFRIPT